MLTPGIEPGLPKPQSGVLPLYYVSFLFYHFSTHFSLFHSSTPPPQIPFLHTKWLRGRSHRISLFCSKIHPSPPSTHFSNHFYSLAFPLHRSWSRRARPPYPSHRVPLLGLLYDSSSRGGLLLMPPWVSWVRPKTDRTSSTDSPRFYI